MKKRFLPFTMLMILAFSIPLTAQWEPTVTNQFPTNHRVVDMQYVDALTIWAFSSYDAFSPPAVQLPVVHRSTDGGQTWVSHSIAGQGGIHARDISAIDSLTAYVALPNSGLYRTQNGGADWEEITVSSVFSTFFFVHFYNENEGWVFGRKSNQHPVSATTADGGVSWTVIDEANMPSYLSNEYYGAGYATNASYDVVDDVVVINTSLGYYWKSTDKAQSWERISTPASDLGLWIAGIVMKDESTIMLVTGGNASTDLPTVTYTTTDGGATWNSGSPGVTPGTVCYVPGTDGTFVICGHNNFIPANKYGTALSYDFGQTWHYIDDTRLISMDFLDDETGIAALGKIVPWGSQGEVFKWNGGSLRAPIFVNDDATGNNNGTSWTDAFPNLQDALAAANDGDQIWVAEGTYLPGDDPTASFVIEKNIHLYGGFAGTENYLSERGDPAEHPAVLSGDLNGDDVEDDFVHNKSDNVMTVVIVTAQVMNETVIDGFTIQNGHADGTQDNQQRNGGAVYSSGSPHFSQCIFRQNYAIGSGGAIRQNAGTSPGIQVESCRFEKNKANYGGGFYLTGSSFSIMETDFIGNTTFDGQYQANGGGMWAVNSSGTIKGCLFEDNYAFEYGGGLHVWNPAGTSNSHVQVLDCTFENNTADSGVGGMSFLSFGNNNSYAARGCTFTGNHSVWYGSALSATIRGENVAVEIENCNFSNNTCDGEATVDLWGTDGGSGSMSVDSCVFENNNSAYAGALNMGNSWNGGADVSFTVSNSMFRNNTAMEHGAVSMGCNQNSHTDILIDNCEFDGNEGTVRGGAIGFFHEGDNFNVTINRATITNNQSPRGSAIDAYNYFQTTFATVTDLLIENSLITGNTGGVTIALDSTKNFSLLNCTVTDNQTGGVQLSNQSTLALQNTILFNNGSTEYQATTNDVDFTSLGGNLIGDLSLTDSLDASDQQNLDPLFAATGDFQLSMSSPCINRGINDGVTALFDLAGNDRIQEGTVDIGAYESPFVNSAREVIAGEIGLSPNPATDFLFLQLPEDITQPIEISLFDPSGKLLKTQVLTTGQPLELRGLAAGVYWVKAVADERVYTGKFVK